MKKSLLLTASLSLLPFNTFASEKSSLKINLNTAVLNNTAITNTAIMDFGQNSLTLGNYVWDKLEQKTHNKWVASVGAFWIHWGWFWNEHEFGHGLRKNALGIKTDMSQGYSYNFPEFYLQTIFKPVNPSRNNLWDKETVNYKITNKKYVSAYTGTGDELKPTLTSYSKRLIVSQGFNNDSRWAEKIGDTLNEDKFIHSSATISYTLSKLMPLLYISKQGTGDLSELQSATEGLSTSDIKLASTIAFLASSTTYNLWSSFIKGDRYATATPYYKGFRIPDTSAYFSHGIAYKIRSGYKLNKATEIPFAIEFVTKGEEKRTEYTVGIKKKINTKTKAEFNIITGNASQSYTSKLSYKVNDNMIYNLTFEQYDLGTMFGERNTSNYNKQKSNSVYAGVKYTF